MRWLGSSILVLTLLVPAAAPAQSARLADFVGTWVGGQVLCGQVTRVDPKVVTCTARIDKPRALVLRPDSTYSVARPGKAGTFRRWARVAGDTVASEPEAVGSRLALRQGRYLVETGLGDRQDVLKVYRRADAAPGREPANPAPAPAVPLAELVGRWVGGEVHCTEVTVVGDRLDCTSLLAMDITLFIRPDSTVRTQSRDAGWGEAGGDDWRNFSGYCRNCRVTLHDQHLIVTEPNRTVSVYRRVSAAIP